MSPRCGVTQGHDPKENLWDSFFRFVEIQHLRMTVVIILSSDSDSEDLGLSPWGGLSGLVGWVYLPPLPARSSFSQETSRGLTPYCLHVPRPYVPCPSSCPPARARRRPPWERRAQHGASVVV